jgi:hypothetical protein
MTQGAFFHLSKDIYLLSTYFLLKPSLPYAPGLIGYERFTTLWSSVHDAVIAFEEAEALADRQAQDRMLSKALADVRNIVK